MSIDATFSITTKDLTKSQGKLLGQGSQFIDRQARSQENEGAEVEGLVAGQVSQQRGRGPREQQARNDDAELLQRALAAQTDDQRRHLSAEPSLVVFRCPALCQFGRFLSAFLVVLCHLDLDPVLAQLQERFAFAGVIFGWPEILGRASDHSHC